SVFVLDDCDQEIDAEFTLDVVLSDNCEEDGFFERRTYTWIATDACGNSDAISFVVDIMDDIPPVLLNVPANEVVICNDLPPVAAVIAEDPAQPVIIVFNEDMQTGDSPSEFIVTRTWTATDACGNSTQASQGITWIPSTLLACDIIPPGAVQCNTHGVVIAADIFGGLGEISYLWEIEGEKCFIQGGQGTPEIIIYVGWSEIEITLIVTDEFGCSSECHFLLNCLDPIGGSIATLPVEITPEAGINPEDANVTTLDILKHFNIWPNPANETINLSFDSSIEQDVKISLTNSLGQIVMHEEMHALKGFNSKKIDVSHLTEGGYQIQLISQKEMRSKTVVLLRGN
ncbi:MAG TPA: T9SS type A sorting domain-containing protein, partial [Saprospiraceae bacterium]|nr:T9SS type A sorting domain-containing protein [Saprospiraceae bacterium]